MIYVKKLILNNFKGYRGYTTINFNPRKNILIGDNGIGKTTIIQALKLLLKGSRFEYNGISYLAKYINSTVKKQFENSRDHRFTDLPYFSLIVVFGIENENKNLKLKNFNGEYEDNVGIHSDEYGITFKYLFDEQFTSEYNKFLEENKNNDTFTIPFSMYKTEHKTFAGNVYRGIMDPLKSIFIDNDNFEGNPFNMFAKQIYNNLNTTERISIESKFRIINKSLFDDINKNDIPYKLNIDSNSLKFDSIVDVSSKDVSLRELGSGRENLIKTKLSLNLDSKLIIVEEPENHLTPSNTRKQIDQLNNLKNQLIVTTHNSQIVTGLDLNNLIWIKSEYGNKQEVHFNENLDEGTISFFKRRDDIDFLRLLIAKKIILVEGAAEYILMRTFIKKVLNENMSDYEVISMRGRYYDPFIQLVEFSQGKMAVFTDNDADVEGASRIDKIEEKNKAYSSTKIFCDKNIENFTFEVSEYEINKEKIDNEVPINSGAKTFNYNKKQMVSKQLAFMLNHKSQSAIIMLPKYEDGTYRVPAYIEEGLKWLKD